MWYEYRRFLAAARGPGSREQRSIIMKTENLAIVFVDIAGFTPRTSSQTREENLRMLRRFDGAVRPLVRAYNGRVVKTIGDAYLLTFRSPTEALLCSAAIHDKLAESDAEVDPTERFTVRAAVNVGDVRIDGGDVFGEAVNIAARIEGKAAAGEIYFSESVYLSMTKSEVPNEEVGYAELKGIPGKVRLYRVPRTSGDGVGLPFNGLGLNRVRGKLALTLPTDALAPAMDQAQGLLVKALVALTQAFAWWKVEVRRSRLVQYVTAFVIVALIIYLVWAVNHRPATPWQKLHRKLGL